MEDEYWLDKWKENDIGFHQGETNQALRVYLESHFKSHKSFFVPLCGKSQDMLYLRQHNKEVIGVELSYKAVEDFFKENNISHEEKTEGDLQVLSGDRFTLYAGDYFKVSKAMVKNVTAIYDRAALIALNPETQRKYVEHLKNIFSDHEKLEILLVVLAYTPSEILSGPPFPVTEDRVLELYEDFFHIHLLEKDECEAPIKFQEKGLACTERSVYHLKKK